MVYSKTDYNISKLGNFYQRDKTLFRVFAPTYDELYLELNSQSFKMHRNGLVFEIAIGGDLENIGYHYASKDGVNFRDPFAYLSIGSDSIVLDKSKFNKEIIKVEDRKETVIYECNVRDFSSSETYIGNYHKKFLSFTEKGLKKDNYYSLGLDYLVNLGISHIQLMPIFEFDKDHAEYNWGYNPLAYNYLESDYIVDKDDYYAYINEFRKTVNILHQNNIKVVLDVVFNHVYDIKSNDLQKMVPDLFFRKLEDGSYGQGSLCGNEIKSEEPFVRDYIVLMCLRYLDLFDIDGLRFDLMGILDIDTINAVKKQIQHYKKDFIIYGEGWNMGDVLHVDHRASMMNASKLPGIGFFNDEYRDTIINYVSGNNSIRDLVKKVMLGHHNNFDYRQSINYVECHDGFTLIDRINNYLIDDHMAVNRCKLALAMVMLSRGTPFIHMGQEFLRSKGCVENSYNSGDAVNGIDWDLRVLHNDMCDYFKELVRIRKKFHINKMEDIYFEDYYECMIYHIGNLLVIINGTNDDYIYNDGKTYRVIFDVNGACDYRKNDVIISALSLVVCHI